MYSSCFFAGRVGDAARHPFGCRVPAIDLLKMVTVYTANYGYFS
jgi:hypothetical protein